MGQAFRHHEIVEIARREGMVTVEGLAKSLGVTVQTIRRDLLDLSNNGKLERVHGGAVFPSGISNIGYEERRNLFTAAKQRIAKVCAEAVPENTSIFLNIGTSTEAVAHELVRHRDILVVTNNMNVPGILIANSKCDIIVSGGQLRRADGGLVGKLAIDAIRGFKFDYAVIGCSAIDEDGDMLDFDMLEVGVSQTIIRQSRNVFVVADHTKFTRSAPARICSLSEVDIVFTDQPLPNHVVAQCTDWNVRVVIA